MELLIFQLEEIVAAIKKSFQSSLLFLKKNYTDNKKGFNGVSDLLSLKVTLVTKISKNLCGWIWGLICDLSLAKTRADTEMWFLQSDRLRLGLLGKIIQNAEYILVF